MNKRAIQRKTVLPAILLMICLLIPAIHASAETATVQGGWLILRSAPSFNGTAMASYATGTVVTITGQTGAWYAVTAPDGRTGYMLGDYLKLQSGPSDGTTAKVTSRNGLNVRLRTGPGTGYTVMGSYAPGTQVTVLSGGKDWCKVRIGQYTGYMMSKYLTTGQSGGTKNTAYGLPAKTGKVSTCARGRPWIMRPSGSTASVHRRP